MKDKLMLVTNSFGSQNLGN